MSLKIVNPTTNIFENTCVARRLLFVSIYYSVCRSTRFFIKLKIIVCSKSEFQQITHYTTYKFKPRNAAQRNRSYEHYVFNNNNNILLLINFAIEFEDDSGTEKVLRNNKDVLGNKSHLTN